MTLLDSTRLQTHRADKGGKKQTHPHEGREMKGKARGEKHRGPAVASETFRDRMKMA